MSKLLLTVALVSSIFFSSLSLGSYDSEIQKAIEEKKVDSVELLRLFHSQKITENKSALNALSKILTNESCELLIQNISLFTSPDRIESFLFALGQHAWEPKVFESSPNDCGAKVLPILQSLQTLHSPSIYFETLGRWNFKDPHSFLLMILKSSDSFSPSQKAAAFKGWMESKTARYIQLQNPKAPEIPAELPALIEKELRKNIPNAVRREILNASLRWKIPLTISTLEKILRENNGNLKDNDLTFFVLSYIKRFSIENADSLLTPYSLSSHKGIRLESILALINQPFSSKQSALKNFILKSIQRETNIPAKATILESYLLSPYADKTSDESLQFFKNEKSGWVRATALSAFLKKSTDAVEKMKWVEEGLNTSSLQIQLVAVDTLKEMKDFNVLFHFLQKYFKQAHPLLKGSLLSLFEKLPELSQSVEFFQFLKNTTLSEEVMVRLKATELLFSFKENPLFQSEIEKILIHSENEAWIDVRTTILEKTIKDLTATQAFPILQTIMMNDKSPKLSNLARKTLLERGVENCPPEQKETFPFSPYLNLKLLTNRPKVEFNTNRGKIIFELFADETPSHVRTFLGLIQSGFYNGMEFYRVEPDWVIQGGDKEGTGWGSPGFSLRGENTSRIYQRGTLGMARSDSLDSGSSHFFVTYSAAPHLDGLYTPFGRVVKGMNVIENIELQDKVISAKILK